MPPGQFSVGCKKKRKKKRKSLRNLLSILDNVSHLLHALLVKQQSTFSKRLIQLRCSKAWYRRSFLPTSDCGVEQIFTVPGHYCALEPIQEQTHWTCVIILHWIAFCLLHWCYSSDHCTVYRVAVMITTTLRHAHIHGSVTAVLHHLHH